MCEAGSLPSKRAFSFARTDSYTMVDGVDSSLQSFTDGDVDEETEYVEEVVYEDVEEDEEAAAAHATAPDKEDNDEAKPAEVAASLLAPAATDTALLKQVGTSVDDPPLLEGARVLTASSAEHEPSLPISAASTHPEPPSGNTAGQAGAEYDLKHLEAQAAKVAKDVQDVAKGVQQKFSAGLQSMLGGVGATAGATASISKVAGGLSSWWSSLDPVPLPKRDETAERIQSSTKASADLQDMFGLGPDENLVELFQCKLLQTYACSHNSFTPAIQMAFQGTLYITDRHTCFSVEEQGRKLPFKVSHAETVKAVRQRPARKGDLSDVLRLETRGPTWLSFKDFDSGSALDSALALVEHLMER